MPTAQGRLNLGSPFEEMSFSLLWGEEWNPILPRSMDTFVGCRLALPALACTSASVMAGFRNAPGLEPSSASCGVRGKNHQQTRHANCSEVDWESGCFLHLPSKTSDTIALAVQSGSSRRMSRSCEQWGSRLASPAPTAAAPWIRCWGYPRSWRALSLSLSLSQAQTQLNEGHVNFFASLLCGSALLGSKTLQRALTKLPRATAPPSQTLYPDPRRS